MSNAIYSAAPSLATIVDTDLNSLANNAIHVETGTIIDNTSNRFFHACAELYLASLDLSSQSNPAVELYMIPAVDGTNYCETGTDATTDEDQYPRATHLAGIFSAVPGSGAAVHRMGIEMFLIGPFKYEAVLINKLGVAFPASGNTLKIGTYTESM